MPLKNLVTIKHLMNAKRAVIPAFMVLFSSPVHAQDWPEAISNRQVEFEMDKNDIEPPEPTQESEITRGQAIDVKTITKPTVSEILRRDIINPFDTKQTEATPVMQMLPEEVFVPDLPDPEIQQQINLDEFRNYLNTLVENPPERAEIALSDKDVQKQLNKIKISSLMTSPKPYVVVNGQRFKIGDRFSMAVSIPAKDTGMEKLIEEQMPDETTLPADIYEEFVKIKEEALEKYRQLKTKSQSDINAGSHNISVIINDIQHRRLVVSVNGDEYVIPIKMAL